VGTKHLARQAERQLERHGDGDSLFFEDRWYTRGWMADQAARFATGLAGLGVRPGDRLVVLMANCPEVLVTYNAAWRAGAVVTPLIFLVSEDELRHALADSGAVAVVTTPEFLPKVQGAARGVDSVRSIVVAGAGVDENQSASGFVWHGIRTAKRRFAPLWNGRYSRSLTPPSVTFRMTNVCAYISGRRDRDAQP